MRNPKLVPYETIIQATSKEPEAVDEVLQHYGKRILSIRCFVRSMRKSTK